MPGRPGSTFNKLQKERARHEKQREKMERRHRRKQEKAARQNSDETAAEVQHEAEPSPPDSFDAGRQ